MSNLFFHIHYCKGRQFPDHGRYAGRITRILQHHALIFFTAGQGNVIIDNKQYPLKAGTLFYICPDVLHSIDLDTQEPIGLLSVHFSYACVSFNDNSWAVSDAVKMLSLHTAQN